MDGGKQGKDASQKQATKAGKQREEGKQGERNAIHNRRQLMQCAIMRDTLQHRVATNLSIFNYNEYRVKWVVRFVSFTENKIEAVEARKSN